jgi:hypothetical protein
MSEKLPLVKNVYSKTQFVKTVNTEFSSPSTPTVTPQIVTASVDQFFNEYQNLFYQIPKQGLTNSHEYLIKTSQEYVGTSQDTSDLDALIDEIDSLRLTIFEQQQTISSLITGSTNG